MQSLSDIKALLDRHGLAPNHALGQNFLTDHNLLTKLVDTANVQQDDVVLEIGPGTGALTTVLLTRGARVIACEYDKGLFELLQSELSAYLNSQLLLFRADCLTGERRLNPALLDAIRGRPFKLVANLPYGAATPLILDLATRRPRCTGMYVTVQREAAQRFRAEPGSKDYGIASVMLAATVSSRRIATLPPECFWPRPKVTSEMIALERLAQPLTTEPERLREVLNSVFQHRRKQIGKALGRDFPFPEDVSPTDRPEMLTPGQFVALADASHARGVQPQRD